MPTGDDNKEIGSNHELEIEPFVNVGIKKGDWEVIGVSERKVKLRCPVSLREFEWNRFCYFVEDCSGVIWPQV